MSAEPPPEPSPSLHALLERLAAARDVATAQARRPPLGVRAIELAEGRRSYLAAFTGPAFLCLDAALGPEPDARRARQVASAGLLVEHAETLVDADALRALAGAVGRLLASAPRHPELEEPIGAVAQAALALAAWREAPERAIASLPALDRAVALQEALLVAYGRFVAASEPLVAIQDQLPPALVADLRALEEAAGRAGATGRLAERLAQAMPGADEGATEILAAHLTRLG